MLQYGCNNWYESKQFKLLCVVPVEFKRGAANDFKLIIFYCIFIYLASDFLFLKNRMQQQKAE